MKGTEQPLHSLMKISPLDDVYQEPKHKYVPKGQWFSLDCESGDENCIEKKTKGFRKKTIGTA